MVVTIFVIISITTVIHWSHMVPWTAHINWHKSSLLHCTATFQLAFCRNIWRGRQFACNNSLVQLGSLFSAPVNHGNTTTHNPSGSEGKYPYQSVQLLSCVWLFETPWTAARQASLSITNSQSLLKLMSIESLTPSNHLILCHPLLLLPSIFSNIRVFSNESALHIRWPKYWSFSFNISLSSEHPGLISFRMNWLDLLAVQGTLKSLLQHHSSKVLILWHSAFFIVQLSHPYMTTGKTIALTRRTFVSKVMSLLFNMLSRLVITFLPRSKRLLISWLQLPSAVILEPKKIVTFATVSPIYLPWSDGTGCHDLHFLNVEL